MRTFTSFKNLQNMDPLERVMEQKIAEIENKRANAIQKVKDQKYRVWKKTVMARSF